MKEDEELEVILPRSTQSKQPTKRAAFIFKDEKFLERYEI